MFILHVTGRSSVRYTPGRIATYWGRYTEHCGAWALLRREGGFGIFKEPLNPHGAYGVMRQPGILQELVSHADVIHCHDDAYPNMIPCAATKTRIYHAHIGDICKRFFRARRFRYDASVKHACISNGYGRIFDAEGMKTGIRWGRLPDILDIEHPILRPDDSRSGKLRAVFTYSNCAELGGSKFNAKAPEAHKRIFAPLNGQVEIEYVHGRSYDEAMAAKRRAHIVIEEIFSPYMHLNCLEGAAVGACVLCHYDDETRRELCAAVGASEASFPFVRVTKETIIDTLLHYADHIDDAIEIGRASRAWMERYYHPRILLSQYLDFYSA